MHLTAYMKEYNANTEKDYTQGYDPITLDGLYKDEDNLLYNGKKSHMPKCVNINFDLKFAGIELDPEIIRQIRESFEKFQSDPLKPFEPVEMKKSMKQYGYDKEYPAMYSMISWITDQQNFVGLKGMTFDEFLQSAIYFFAQRDQDEGLKYIFQLFDRDNSGYLTKEEFQEACADVGF